MELETEFHSRIQGVLSLVLGHCLKPRFSLSFGVAAENATEFPAHPLFWKRWEQPHQLTRSDVNVSTRNEAHTLIYLVYFACASSHKTGYRINKLKQTV